MRTQGRHAAWWIAEHLTHGDGDYLGEPFRLTDQQHADLNAWYQRTPDGDRVVDEVYLQQPSGAGKTELGAAVTLYEADILGAGRESARCYIVANSERQAGETAYGQVRRMVADARGGLPDRLWLRRDEVRRPDETATVRLVPAVAKSFEGLRPSFVLWEETHEFDLEQLGRAYDIVAKSLPKRSDAWSLAISTAGGSVNTKGYELFRVHEQVAEGLLHRPGWWSRVDAVPASVEIPTDPSTADLEELLAYHPAAVAGIIRLERLVAAWQKMDHAEAVRYLANRWQIGSARVTFPPGVIDATPDPAPLEAGEPIVVGFDGSFNRDSTALVAAPLLRREIHLLDVWERPADAGPDEWAVPADEVLARIHALFADFDVVEFAPDPYIWTTELMELETIYGDRVVRFPTTSPSRMVPAVETFRAAVFGDDAAGGGRLAVDKSPTLVRHLGNCVPKPTTYGDSVRKEYPDSPRKIDAAVAAMIALARADWWRDRYANDEALLA